MGNKNYFGYHFHSDYSSCTTNIDSATKIDMYIQKAQECGMTALAFSEHGNVLNWYEKKTKIEAAGMKYVHAVEAYITKTLEEKVRDNYHCILIAKNYEGFKEINRLTTASFNRTDNHYYYRPRIGLQELMNTSDNIIICTACLAGILNSEDEEIKQTFLAWLIEHKDRCYLEIQHHNVLEQKTYNRYLYELSQKFDIPLVTGTDTHSIDEEYAVARELLQKSKNVHFDNEEGFDLTFKTYEQLVQAYKVQNTLAEEVYLQAIENTNRIAEQVEPFELDMTTKYPKLYENSTEVFEKMVYEAIDKHPYALKLHSREEILARIAEELPVYEKTGMIDFMLFQKMVRDWEHENDIFVGVGRGSVSGSYIAYLLGITDMDSIRFNLNFFRFANPDRVSNADIDSDYYDPDRVKTRNFLLTNPRICSAEIAAFGTVKLRGAIRDLGRAMDIPLEEVGQICDQLIQNEKHEDVAPEELKAKYPKLFKYAELINGTITSVGTHPAGVLCASRKIEEEIGLFSLSTTEHPVSCNDMYGLDACWWTKLDCLGLDNVGIINETCKMAEIERITPDNIDLEDWEVWKDIREDTTGIFQFESPYAAQTMKEMFSDTTIRRIKNKIPNLKMLKLMSFANALIRPCGTSVRENAIKGIVKETGIKDIDDLLSDELNLCIIQEDIMLFLMKFCGFSLLEADKARKAIAKKKGTESLLPKIKEGFIINSQEKYDLTDQKVDEIIDPILQCILDATRYAFSWNHSDAYSFIGYACGYLRHYYPLEFYTTCLNIWSDKTEKTSMVMGRLHSLGYNIAEAQFRHSRAKYYCDKEAKIIYKGIGSIKFLNEGVAEELYALREKQYETFSDVLLDICQTSIHSNQLEILIKLDFFKEFGNSKQLIKIYKWFVKLKNCTAKSFRKTSVESMDDISLSILKRYCTETPTQYGKIQCIPLIKEIESYVMTAITDDFPLAVKIQTEQEYLGYISYKTNKPEDRPKIRVSEIRKMIGKFGANAGKPWAVTFKGYSVGSGKLTDYTMFYDIFSKNQFANDNIIYIDGWEKKKDYFYITKFHLVS